MLEPRGHMQKPGELEKVLDRIEGLLGTVREAFLKEREMLEKCDVAKAADASTEGVRLLQDAARTLAEALEAVERIEVDAATKDRLERMRLTLFEVWKLEMENQRTGIRLMEMFHRPKQAH